MDRFLHKLALCLSGAVLLSGCNSGDGGTNWQKGVFIAPEAYQAYCAAPRSGTNPYTGEAFPDKQGSQAHEKHFLRAWNHQDYLWYDEVEDINPNLPTSTQVYFENLKTFEKTANNTFKDKYHFASDEISDDQLVYTGEVGGFGIHWASNNGHDFYVKFVEPNSPAALAGVSRGMLLRRTGDVSYPLEGSDYAAINEVLGYPNLNKTYDLGFDYKGNRVDVSVTAQNLTVSAVYDTNVFEQNGQKIAYVAFNSFNILKGEFELKEAFDSFATQGVNELVLDLRYNGGGFLFIAAQLGYQIAGSAANTKTFAELRYNDKRSNNNEAIPFYSVTSENQSRPLSTLNLNRVYVITTGNTCSASEAVMNGLRGIGVEVIQIGTTTCGKPYGFNARANCGRRYYSVDFEYTNDQGFSDFGDGFEPVATGGTPQSNKINGCKIDDDLNHEYGSPDEAMLKTALYHIQNGSCPSVSNNPASLQKTRLGNPNKLLLIRPESQEVLIGGWR